MKKTSKKDNDGLIKGIRAILSKNRCSLTDEEVALLQESIGQLEKDGEQHLKINWKFFIEIVSTILRFIAIIKDFF